MAVTASSNDTTADSASSPLNVTDGDPLTRWQASPDSSQWLQIDLGQSDSVSGITIDWANKTFARNLAVETSSDSSTWSLIDSAGAEERTANYAQFFDSLNSVGRYIKLLISGEGNGPYSISEIEVYGSPGPATVVRGTGAVPGEYQLYQDYLNPFNPTTVIRYRLPVVSNVTLKLYDVPGREIATLVHSSQSPGLHSVEFDGSHLASGMYFYKLSARPISGQSGGYVKVMKMVLLK